VVKTELAPQLVNVTPDSMKTKTVPVKIVTILVLPVLTGKNVMFVTIQKDVCHQTVENVVKNTSMLEYGIVIHVTPNVLLVKTIPIKITLSVLPVLKEENKTHLIVTVQMVKLLMKIMSVDIVIITVLIVTVNQKSVLNVLKTELMNHIVNVQMVNMMMDITQNVTHVKTFV